MRSRRILVIVALVCVGTLALIGLVIDLRQVCLEREQIARATEGAAVAGVNRLPLEGAACESALGYLQCVYDDQNWERVRIVTNAGDSTGTVTGPLEADAVMTIWVDTAFARDWDAENPMNTAHRMRVRVRKQVPMAFLRVVGVKGISVEDSAEAEQTPPPVVVVVSDVSGSVKFETLCFGCLEEGCTYSGCWAQCDVKDAPNRCTKGGIGDAVLASLDESESSELADIVDGMKKGIAVLSPKSMVRGRQRALVMILIADRNPSVAPHDEPHGQECWRQNLWTSDEGEDTREQQAADCAVHYAREAKENGIRIYTISLGNRVDQSLMEEIANITSGYHDWGSTCDELDEVFDSLFYTGGARITR